MLLQGLHIAFWCYLLMVEEITQSHERVNIDDDEEEEVMVEEDGTQSQDVIPDSEVAENEQGGSNDGIGKNEISLLAKHLDAQELDVVIQQIKTDDNILEIGSRFGLLTKFQVNTPNIMIPIQVSVPLYESVKYLKRRIFKESLKKGSFTKIDKYHLVWDQSPEKQVVLTEEMPQTFENFLPSFGFEAGEEYHLSSKVNIQASKDKEVQDSMIHESKARAAQGAFSHLKYSDDESIRKMQRIFQGEDVDDVHYVILPDPARTPGSGGKRVHEEMANTGRMSKRPQKWTKQRTDFLIEKLVQCQDYKRIWKSILDDGTEKLDDAGNSLFPTISKDKGNKDTPALKSQGISFKSGELHDKWKNIKRYFDDNGEPDSEKLSATRTLSLDEDHIRMVSDIIRQGYV